MIGFGFEVPAGDLGYQLKTTVHVITVEEHVGLTPVLKPPPVVLKRKKEQQKITVYFDFDSYRFKSEEKKKLLKVKGSVTVTGYASPEGSDSYNLKLSLKRARAVADFLKKRGVKILKTEGKGEECFLRPSLWSLCRKVEVMQKK